MGRLRGSKRQRRAQVGVLWGTGFAPGELYGRGPRAGQRHCSRDLDLKEERAFHPGYTTVVKEPRLELGT